MHDVHALIDQVLAQELVPSISLNVRVENREVLHVSRGLACIDPKRPIAEDHPYDLASVTKALVGSAVTASLVQAGQIDVDEPVADILPDVDPRITARHLLQHTSGYPAWLPLYERAFDAWGLEETRRTILREARMTPLQSAPNEAHVYSDIGFLVLLNLIEAVTGERLDAVFRERILQPLGQRNFRWGWPEAAATERCPVRQRLVVGSVHDLNSASIGGISTHAGLFAPARYVSQLAEAYLNAVLDPDSSPQLPGKILAEWWSQPGLGTHRGGWDTVTTDGYTSTGRFFPADAVGHLGYTGTSVWVVPSRHTVITLLTNRVHPVDNKEPIRQLRPLVHDAVATALGWAS